MQHLSDNIEIDARIEDVFKFTSDPRHAPEWIPGMVEVSNIKEKNGQQEYDWVFKMVGIKLNGHSERRNLRKNEGFETHSSGAIKSTWKYSFEQRNNRTRVNLAIDYEVPAPVGKKIAEKMLLKQHERELDQALHLLKDLVEHQFKRSSAAQ